MSTYTSQTEKDKNLSVSTNTSQEFAGGETTSAVVDNRPVAIAQQQLQTMASKSPHVVKNTQLQAAIGKSNAATQPFTNSNKVAQRVSINLQPADPVIKKLLKYTKEKLGVNDQVLESIESAENYIPGKTENIYLFGHGGYSGVDIEEHDLFAGTNMQNLAAGLHANIAFPEGYTGTIYLIGCKTDTLLSSFKTQLDQLTGKSLNIKGTTETLQTGTDDDISLRDQPGTESEVKRREIADIQRYFYRHLIELRNLRGTALKGVKEADDFEKKKTAIMAAYKQKNIVDDRLNATRSALEKLKNVTSIKLLGKKSGIKSMEEIFAQSKQAQNQIEGYLMEFLDLYEKKPLPDNASDLERQIVQKLTNTLKEDQSQLSEQVAVTAMMVQINDEPDLLGTTAFSLDQMVDVTGAKRVKHLKDSQIQFNSVTDQIQGWTQTALKRTLLWKEINTELANPQQDWSKGEIATAMNLKIKKLGTYLSVLHRIHISQTSPDLLYESANKDTRRKLDIDYDFSVKKNTFIRLLEREKPESFISSALELCNQMHDIYNRLTVEAATETSSTLDTGWPFGM
jgi:hypothetical protein